MLAAPTEIEPDRVTVVWAFDSTVVKLVRSAWLLVYVVTDSFFVAQKSITLPLAATTPMQATD
jgi:hypothetical protein